MECSIPLCGILLIPKIQSLAEKLCEIVVAEV